jgi:hypothetical protein
MARLRVQPCGSFPSKHEINQLKGTDPGSVLFRNASQSLSRSSDASRGRPQLREGVTVRAETHDFQLKVKQVILVRFHPVKSRTVGSHRETPHGAKCSSACLAIARIHAYAGATLWYRDSLVHHHGVTPGPPPVVREGKNPRCCLLLRPVWCLKHNECR